MFGLIVPVDVAEVVPNVAVVGLDVGVEGDTRYGIIKNSGPDAES